MLEAVVGQRFTSKRAAHRFRTTKGNVLSSNGGAGYVDIYATFL